MNDDLIERLVDLVKQALPIIGLEAAKAGSGELAKIFAKSFSEKMSVFLGKLFSKRPLVEAIKEIEQKKPNEDDQNKIIKKALDTIVRIDIDVSEAKDLFEFAAKKGGVTIELKFQRDSLLPTQIKSMSEYIENLNSQVSQMGIPGIPEFPSGIEPSLQDIYVDQKFYDSRTERIVGSHYFEYSKNNIWLKDTAGTGKSTFIKHITSLICTNYLLDGNAERSIKKIPIKLHARDIAMPEGDDFSNNILNLVLRNHGLNGDLLQELSAGLQDGNIVLLIDAIDEVSVNSQKYIIQSLATSSFLSKRNQIILTSRPLNLDLNIVSGQLQRFSVNDAYKLITNWQNVLEKNSLLSSKGDEFLEKFKNEYIGKIYKSGGIKNEIIETPLFLTFLIFYLSSPRTEKYTEPFNILNSKTRLLSQIIEFVIPYWESQKLGRSSFINPLVNAEALQVLYFIGYFSKLTPNASINDLLWGISLNEKTLLIDSEKAKEYILLWSQTNVIRFDNLKMFFWHEELRDFCAAKYLSFLYKNDFVDDADIRNKLELANWKTVRSYFNNILRH